MQYWEEEYNGEHFRMVRIDEKTYSLQTLFYGEWVDYHVYEVDEETCDGKEGVK